MELRVQRRDPAFCHVEDVRRAVAAEEHGQFEQEPAGVGELAGDFHVRMRLLVQGHDLLVRVQFRRVAEVAILKRYARRGRPVSQRVAPLRHGRRDGERHDRCGNTHHCRYSR
jgi:hypothetical protein